MDLNQLIQLHLHNMRPDPLPDMARSKYGFIAPNTRMVPATNSQFGSEGWPVGETGDSKYPRPANIPLNVPGVQYNPQGSADDLAGEVMHTDPVANNTRAALTKTLSPDQLKYMSNTWLDMGPVGPSQDAPMNQRIQNGVDAAMRGYLVNQAPASVNKGMNWTPSQLGMLDQLHKYMLSGKQ